MCALEPPFIANSIHGLALKIVRGNYPQLPLEYSRDLRALLSHLLVVEPRDRPTIHQILRLPILLSRIQTFLSAYKLQEEFSHTILHNRSPNVERSSRKNQKNMLEKILKRRKELDIIIEDQDRHNDEKVLCEMNALILEQNIIESNDVDSPSHSSESYEENSTAESIDKVTQLRSCLKDMIGHEIFQLAYDIIYKIDSEGNKNDLKIYNAHLKHIMNIENQEEFIPMIQALIQMENS